MPRFFVESQPIPGQHYELTGESCRHISRSLRMTHGESLVLCDGAGTDFFCRVENINSEAVGLSVLSAQPSMGEALFKVHVYQCIPKSDKLETVIQKSVELGAFSITPVKSSRCISKTDAKTDIKKNLRYNKIAMEAAMQSGRGIIPRVELAMDFSKAIEQASERGKILFFYEEGGEALKPLLRSLAPLEGLCLFIGPEGGFDPKEVELAKNAGASILTLGNRILRTETVALSTLSMIFYERDGLV